jgi:hypothetical protein
MELGHPEQTVPVISTINLNIQGGKKKAERGAR